MGRLSLCCNVNGNISLYVDGDKNGNCDNSTDISRCGGYLEDIYKEMARYDKVRVYVVESILQLCLRCGRDFMKKDVISL